MAKWVYITSDNSGKRHNYTITAKSKPEAIKKGHEKALKNAKGDLSCHWECHLKSV